MTAFETTMPVRLDPASATLDREVDVPPHGQTIRFGAHGAVAEHYRMRPSNPLPTTLDYLVASVAGCLIGTFAGSLKRARVPVSPATLDGTATGSVESDDDGVLRLRRITVRYALEVPAEHAAAAEEVHAAHAARCPNARSVGGSIEVVTELRVTQPAGA
ncbi:OsmC family protein [Miltoncostaea marina]|uniref:OsmC family protein n=1 Tax=Miltoncostaea marina TaxID=2843215 RepID=UPI001C3DECA0|nr:OsmC family protein [Miltoncostaea marina]